MLKKQTEDWGGVGGGGRYLDMLTYFVSECIYISVLKENILTTFKSTKVSLFKIILLEHSLYELHFLSATG